jgi:transposase
VSREMNISASTVKMIVKKFTEDGEIFEKKSERKLRLKEKRNEEK